jgi:hypothetical protein
MDIEAFIRDRNKGNPISARYFDKMAREAYNKYVSFDTFELQCHQQRIQQEERLFGSTFRTTAGLQIINVLLSERTTL